MSVTPEEGGRFEQSTFEGWIVRRLRSVGKTEVLCADAAALKKLKNSAVEIDASEVYPSFRPAFPYTLFFFDVRDEFLEWLNQYAAAWPASRVVDVPRSSGSGPGPDPGMPRKFGFAEAATASIFLLLISGLLVWGAPKISRPDIVSSLGTQRLALPRVEQPGLPPMAVLIESSPAAPELLDTSAKNSADSGAGHSGSSETLPTAGARDHSVSIIETVIDTAVSISAKPVASSLPALSASPLKVWFVDVGQGDGIILKLPNGKFVIIDSNEGSGDKMADLLTSLGCRDIEAMVMTHPHADHLGGLDAILSRFKVRKFYDPGMPHPTAGYRRLLLAVEKNGCAYIIPKTGQKLDWDRDVTITVLSAGPESGDGVNNSSIVLKMDFGRTAMIFTGDAEAAAEQGVVSRFAGKLRADLLKVGHHGSHSSSTPEFLREIAPRFAVISCGIGNTYGHPAPITLTNLAGIGARIFRTDLEGTITAESDGREIHVRPLSSKASAR